jgi:hypothetical protein
MVRRLGCIVTGDSATLSGPVDSMARWRVSIQIESHLQSMGP